MQEVHVHVAERNVAMVTLVTHFFDKKSMDCYVYLPPPPPLLVCPSGVSEPVEREAGSRPLSECQAAGTGG